MWGAPPVPPNLKKVVAFIYLRGPTNDFRPNGTGFFVSLPKTGFTNQWFVYLVTARHVLTPPAARDFHSEIFLRLETRRGGVETFRIPLASSGPDKNVYCPVDNADVAVIPLTPNQELFDYKTIPGEMITGRDVREKGISEGTEIFFAGLFSRHTGEVRNFPIFRFGHVALVSEEKIEFFGEKRDLYLMESSSYGGNSGSPVFFYLGAERKAGVLSAAPPKLLLAGVMMGSFNDLNPLRNMPTTNAIPISISNMGISAVTPAYKLREVLESDELKQTRDKR